jgi:AcrR family transcriptional regulator
MGHRLASPDDAARLRILDSALDSFSTLGFDGASIALIARQHGVSPPLIHYYFRNKTELWQAAIDFGLTHVMRELQSLIRDLQDVDAVSKLKFLIRRYIAVMARHPAAFQAIIRESQDPGPRLTWLSQHYLVPLYSIVTETIEEGQRAGRLKTIVPSYHLAQIIMGACYQFISSHKRMKEVYGIDTTSPEVIDRHASAVIEFLFNGILEPG